MTRARLVSFQDSVRECAGPNWEIPTTQKGWPKPMPPDSQASYLRLDFLEWWRNRHFPELKWGHSAKVPEGFKGGSGNSKSCARVVQEPYKAL